MSDAPLADEFFEHHLIDVARRAAHAGGAVIREAFGRAVPIEVKSPGDYVSAVDRAAEEAIRVSLAHDTPAIEFLGEEAGGSLGSLGWLVDPLDGTANFLHAFPVVGVSVALIEDGAPIVGVVHAPMLGETFTARLGGGAFVERADGRVEQLAVSARSPDRAICATGFPFRRPDLVDRYLRAFDAAFRRFEDLRRPGTASLDLAWTAAGVFDGFFELALGPWDVAAGALLVREAGGVVTDWSGDDRAWLTSGSILAGPPAIHAALRDLADETSDR